MLLGCLTVLTTTHVAVAQGPSTPLDPDGDPDDTVPIDGGASVLIAAGVAYGLKKVYDKRNENKKVN